jgi:LDH2 family malate/lactate/ureidoglycolate dehydrogenase
MTAQVGGSKVTIGVDDARKLAERSLRGLDYSAEEASIIADHLVEAGLAGYEFASLPRVLVLERWEDRPKRQPIRVVERSRGRAVVDGGRNCGYLAVRFGTDLAIELARESGIAIVSVSNTRYSGRIAYYVRMVTKAGFVSLHFSGGSPSVAPYGGRKRALGTNPMAFGFPTATGPVVFDTATSALSWGEIELAETLGQSLPEGMALDVDGAPTTDPAAALAGATVPFAGHKGYGFSVVSQLFAVLAGEELVDGHVRNTGEVLIVIDPEFLAPGGHFTERASEVIAHIRATPPAYGHDGVRLPGDGSSRTRERLLASGLTYDRVVLEALETIARRGNE